MIAIAFFKLTGIVVLGVWCYCKIKKGRIENDNY